MNALNAIPIIGWIMAAVIWFFAAIPIYLLWNWLAPIYFYWLPGRYLDIPFWHVFGLLWLVVSLRQVFLPSFSTTVNNGKKDK